MVVLYNRCMDKVLIACFTGISYVNRLFLLFWAISQVLNGDCDLWNDDSKAWGLCFPLWTEGRHISLNNCSFSQDLNPSYMDLPVKLSCNFLGYLVHETETTGRMWGTGSIERHEMKVHYVSVLQKCWHFRLFTIGAFHFGGNAPLILPQIPLF